MMPLIAALLLAYVVASALVTAAIAGFLSRTSKRVRATLPDRSKWQVIEGNKVTSKGDDYGRKAA
jgi:hypothetical protein